MRAVYALYAGPEEAQRAVNALQDAGVADREITVMSGGPIDDYAFGQRDTATWLPWIAGLGGAVGLVAGTVLAYTTQRAWPLVTGNMPIIAWWPNLIVMFELTMLGGMLATVTTLLITARIPSRGPKLYDPEVADGKILVGVENPPEGSVSELQRVLLAIEAGRVKTIQP